jgi:hypothetical protein
MRLNVRKTIEITMHGATMYSGLCFYWLWNYIEKANGGYKACTHTHIEAAKA